MPYIPEIESLPSCNRYRKKITASDSQSEVTHVQASDWESHAVAITEGSDHSPGITREIYMREHGTVLALDLARDPS